MPSPPTTMAMTRQVFFIRRELARLRVTRRRARAVRTDFGDRAMARGFEQLRVERAWRPVAPARCRESVNCCRCAARTIDDGDGLAIRAAALPQLRLLAVAPGCQGHHGGRAACRRSALSRAVGSAAGLVATTADRLAAQRIVDEHGPSATTTSQTVPARRPALRRGDRQLRQALYVCPGRGGRSGHLMPRRKILANHRMSLARDVSALDRS